MKNFFTAAVISIAALCTLEAASTLSAKAYSAYTDSTAQAVDLDGTACDTYSDFAREICLDMSINDHLWN